MKREIHNAIPRRTTRRRERTKCTLLFTGERRWHAHTHNWLSIQPRRPLTNGQPETLSCDVGSATSCEWCHLFAAGASAGAAGATNCARKTSSFMMKLATFGREDTHPLPLDFFCTLLRLTQTHEYMRTQALKRQPPMLPQLSITRKLCTNILAHLCSRLWREAAPASPNCPPCSGQMLSGHTARFSGWPCPSASQQPASSPEQLAIQTKQISKLR